MITTIGGGDHKAKGCTLLAGKDVAVVCMYAWSFGINDWRIKKRKKTINFYQYASPTNQKLKKYSYQKYFNVI